MQYSKNLCDDATEAVSHATEAPSHATEGLGDPLPQFDKKKICLCLSSLSFKVNDKLRWLYF